MKYFKPGLTIIKATNLFMICMVVAMSFSACKRITVEANTNPQGYADSEVVGNWKITEVLSDRLYDWDGNGTKEKDVYATYDECEKNMLYQFIHDKTGVYQINCNTTKNGTWQILNTLYLVWIPEGSAVNNEKISNMTSNYFYTTRTVHISLGDTYVVTSKWERQ